MLGVTFASVRLERVLDHVGWLKCWVASAPATTDAYEDRRGIAEILGTEVYGGAPLEPGVRPLLMLRSGYLERSEAGAAPTPT